jgi:hypothetical protein
MFGPSSRLFFLVIQFRYQFVPHAAVIACKATEQF